MINVKRMQFNIIVYIVGSLMIPILGVAIEGAAGLPPATISLLLFIITPILLAILLRTVGKDGWKTAGLGFKFEQSKGWYGWSILAGVLGVVLSFLFASLIFSSDFRFSSMAGSAAVTFVLLMFFQLIKNIAEEFGWRGYLMPQLAELGIADWVNILIVGFFWAAWHVPAILSSKEAKEIITTYQGDNMTLFIVLFFVGVMIVNVTHHWLRKASGTIWTNVIFHTISNALFGIAITQAVLPPMFENFFTQGVDPGTIPGLISWTIIAGITWFLAWRFGPMPTPQPEEE